MKTSIFAGAALIIGLALGRLSLPQRYDSENASHPIEPKTLSTGAIDQEPQMATWATPWFSKPLISGSACEEALRKLDELSGSYHPLVLGAIRDRILRSWLVIDPEGALAFAENKVRGVHEPEIAADLFRVWIDLDLESAISGLWQAGSPLITAVIPSFIESVARIDPERALVVLDKIPDSVEDFQADSSAYRLYAVWAAEDPNAAVESAKKYESGNRWWNPMKAVAETWAESDPEAAWDYFSSLPVENKRYGQGGFEQAKFILPSLIEKVPDFEFGDYFSRQNFSDYTNSQFAEYWAENNYESAISYAKSHPENDRFARALLVHAAEEIATAEPERALHLLESVDGSSRAHRNRSVTRNAFAALASADLENSVERWAKLPDKFKTNALAGVMNYQLATDPEAAIAKWQEWAADPAFDTSLFPALQVALSSGHGGGVQDVGAVIQAIPELSNHVSGWMLGSWAKNAPEGTAEFYLEAIQSGRDFYEQDDNDIDNLRAVAEITHSRPEFAAGWVSRLPAGQFQNDAAATLAVNWSRINPVAAAEWIGQLPEGAVFDSVAAALEDAETQPAQRRR